MPLPTPNDGESRDHFISRCMGNPTMNTDFPDQNQRAAVCNSQWRDSKKDETARGALRFLERRR